MEFDDADAADYYADADALEILTRPPNHSAIIMPDLAPSVTELELLPEPETPDEVIQPDTGSSGSQQPLIIDAFPFGNPGMPIDGPDSPTDDTSQMDPNGTSWAPFCSQLDWEFARWAKLRGVSSSALNELLSLPQVRPSPSDMINFY